jgi:hypothetical protein
MNEWKDYIYFIAMTYYLVRSAIAIIVFPNLSLPTLSFLADLVFP